jgi:hypothetical protein
MYSVQAIQQLPHKLPTYLPPTEASVTNRWCSSTNTTFVGNLNFRACKTGRRTSPWNAIPHYLVVVVQVVEPWSFIPEKFRKKFPSQNQKEYAVKNSSTSTKKSSQKNFSSQNQKEYAVKNSPISKKNHPKKISPPKIKRNMLWKIPRLAKKIIPKKFPLPKSKGICCEKFPD